MTTFHVEHWADCNAEIQELWPAHYEEIGDKRIPLDPDLAKYERLADAGCLHVVTARRDGELVGYSINVVDTHLHYRTTLFAFSDLYWVKPVARGPRFAKRFFDFIEESLRRRGVVKAITNTKTFMERNDHSRLFTHLGWQRTERVFTKYLGA